MHFITYYIALSSAVAGIAAFPIDTTVHHSTGTGLRTTDGRNPTIASYNQGQGVFSREPVDGKGGAVASPNPPSKVGTPNAANKGTKRTGNKATNGQGQGQPAQRTPKSGLKASNSKAGASCPRPKFVLKKLPPPNKTSRKAVGPPTNGKPTTGKPTTGKRTGGRKRGLQRRTVGEPEQLTSDPTIGGERLGEGMNAAVYTNPLDSTQVIKKFKTGVSLEEIKKEIESYQLVGQYAGRYGVMGTGMFNTIYYVFLVKVAGSSMSVSPLWTSYRDNEYRDTAMYYIRCAIKAKLSWYASMGIRHPDLFQDNVMLSGSDLTSLSVEFVDWAGMTIQYPIVLPTEEELEEWTTKAMGARSWSMW